MKKLTKEQKIFYGRLAGFILTGFVAPITYLIIRYNLFTKSTGVTIGLWGVVVFALVVVLAGILVYFYIQGCKFKYTIWKQIASGSVKVIGPMLIGVLLLQALKDNVDLMLETLYVFMGCEAVAIVVNPLPKWAFSRNLTGFGDIISNTVKKSYNDIKTEISNNAQKVNNNNNKGSK